VLTRLKHTGMLYIQPASSLKTPADFLQSFYMFLINLRILSPNILSGLDFVMETHCTLCHGKTRLLNTPLYLDIFQDLEV
jgi:hypothetical protein